MNEFGWGIVVGLGLLTTAGAVGLVVVQLWRDARTWPTNGAGPPRSEGEVVRCDGVEGAR